jgi:hypothetical protein
VSPKTLATAFEHCLDPRSSSGRFSSESSSSPRQSTQQSEQCTPPDTPITELQDDENEISPNGLSDHVTGNKSSEGKEMEQSPSLPKQDGQDDQDGQEGLRTLLVEDNPINLRVRTL